MRFRLALPMSEQRAYLRISTRTSPRPFLVGSAGVSLPCRSHRLGKAPRPKRQVTLHLRSECTQSSFGRCRYWLLSVQSLLGFVRANSLDWLSDHRRVRGRWLEGGCRPWPERRGASPATPPPCPISPQSAAAPPTAARGHSSVSVL